MAVLSYAHFRRGGCHATSARTDVRVARGSHGAWGDLRPSARSAARLVGRPVGLFVRGADAVARERHHAAGGIPAGPLPSPTPGRLPARGTQRSSQSVPAPGRLGTTTARSRMW